MWPLVRQVTPLHICCASAPVASNKHAAPQNRKQGGEARVYGIMWPQRSFLFRSRAAALRACFCFRFVLAWNVLTLAQGQENMTPTEALKAAWMDEEVQVPLFALSRNSLALVPTDFHGA